MTQPLALTPLEIVTGTPLGIEPGGPPPLLDEPDSGSPRVALEAALRPALERGPCAVTFSGGVDSSLLLAVAMGLARREGLEAPVAVTARFRNAPGTREDDWQERVIGLLGVEDWVRVEIDDELDLVGPRAASLLQRHGVVSPAHIGLYDLLAERAACPSLVTGYGGDQIGSWSGAGPSPRLPAPGLRRSAMLTAYRAAPFALRRRAMRAQLPPREWLRPEALREFNDRWTTAAAGRHVGWADYLDLQQRRRALVAIRASFDAVLAQHGTEAVHPLLDRGVLAALARAGGRRGLGARAATFALLAADDLPAEILRRPSKAHFLNAYLRAPSRAFARAWDGTFPHPSLIDPQPLRAAWLGRIPRGSTFIALQAAWLACNGSAEREQPARDLR